MAEPLYPERGLVLFDAEGFRVLGPPAGPAGASTVELPDGSTWQVDHVDPSSFVQLEVDVLDPASSALLTGAFGGDGALFMVERAVHMDEMDPLLVESSRPEAARVPPRVHPLRQSTAGDAGRTVLLVDLASDRRIHPLARIAAYLEGANELALRGAPPILEPLGPSLLEGAVGLAAQFDDEEFELLDDETAMTLGDLCSTAQKIHVRPDVIRPGLDGLLQRVLGLTARRRTHGVAAALIAEDRAEWEPEEELLSAAPPPISALRLPEARELVAERVGDSLFEVTVTRSEDHRWARVLHRESLVLLGQAPLRRRGLVDFAEVVVPADLADEDLDVQVLESGELSRLVDRPLDAIRAAISAGRKAARAGRLGDTGVARVRWERCALLWEDAGDRDRAVLARDLGRVAGMSWVRPIETVDRVAEALAGQV